MVLTKDKIKALLDIAYNEENEKKERDPNYEMFLGESYFIDRLNAKTEEDIENIRIMLSSYIDAVNSVCLPEYKINTDLDELEMVKAAMFRKNAIEPHMKSVWELLNLRKTGQITDEEYEKQKNDLINKMKIK